MMRDERAECLWDGEERRESPRFTPVRNIPVLFRHPRAPGLGAGDVVDLSSGGCRVVAPPTVITPVRWGEPLVLTLSYSESTRDAGLEGMVLEAVIVEVHSTSRAMELRLRFVQPLSAEWTARLAGLLANAA